MAYYPAFNDLSKFKFVQILKWPSTIIHVGYYTSYQTIESDLSLDLTKLLVSKNIDLTPDKQEYCGHNLDSLALVASIGSRSPLARSEVVDILMLLIDNGASQNEVDPSGRTFIHYLSPSLKIAFLEKYNNSVHKKINKIYIAKKCMMCLISEDDKNDKIIEMQLTNCGHAVLCMDCFTKLPDKKCIYCNSKITSNKSITYI